MNIGVMPLDDGARVDFTRLRSTRRERVFAAMADRGFDVLILGRDANARYATGVRRLPVSISRPFAPGAVLVGRTRDTHLMSVWDDGVPPEIPRQHLYGTSWDPAKVLGSLLAIEGFASARTIAVDAISPLWRDLLTGACPRAVLVDGTPMLRAVRMRKTPDEVECIRTAVAVAESALLASVRSMRPGIRERELLGAFVARMAAFGITTPAAEGVFCVLDPGQSAVPAGMRRMVSERVVDDGDLVAVGGGVAFGGYEGTVGRTAVCRIAGRGASRAQAMLLERWEQTWARLFSVLRPGATGADIRRVYEESGCPPPSFPYVSSVGLGAEIPIAGSPLGVAFDAQWGLEPGMVLQVQAVTAGTSGGYYGLDTVLVTANGPELLTSLEHRIFSSGSS